MPIEYGRDLEYYVYQHNQKEQNKFYVYLHRRLSDNFVFYVGKGCGYRAWVTTGRSKHWENVVNKHGYIVEIVFDDLDEKTAYSCEEDAIKEFKYFGALLVNIATGGEGPVGVKHNAETIEKCKIARMNSQKWRDGHAKANEKRRGKKLPEHVVNKRRDMNIYTFVKNEEGFTGTRRQFEETTGVDPDNLFRKSGVHKSVHGWKLLSE